MGTCGAPQCDCPTKEVAPLSDLLGKGVSGLPTAGQAIDSGTLAGGGALPVPGAPSYFYLDDIAMHRVFAQQPTIIASVEQTTAWQTEPTKGKSVPASPLAPACSVQGWKKRDPAAGGKSSFGL